MLPLSLTFQIQRLRSSQTPPPFITRTPASIKVLYSIGGDGVDPSPFAAMASSVSSRLTFIHATIEVARKYGFYGVDLDWEFPESTKEMDDFAHLLKEWRHAIQKEARSRNKPPLLLTAAVYYSADFLTYGSCRSYQPLRSRRIWIECYLSSSLSHPLLSNASQPSRTLLNKRTHQSTPSFLLGVEAQTIQSFH
jgi:hypothetical protein